MTLHGFDQSDRLLVSPRRPVTRNPLWTNDIGPNYVIMETGSRRSHKFRVLLLLKMACVVVRCCVLVVGPDGFVRWVPAMLYYPVGEFNSFTLT